MAVAWTLAGVLNMAGGLVLAGFGLGVGLAPPRGRLQRSFGVFAASFGLTVLVTNPIIMAEPGTGWIGPASFIALSLQLGTGLGLLLLWRDLPSPIDRRELGVLWLPAAVTVSMAAVGAWALWSAGSLPPGLQAAPHLAIGVIVDDAIWLGLLFVLTLRFLQEDAPRNVREQAPVLTAGLSLFPAVNARLTLVDVPFLQPGVGLPFLVGMGGLVGLWMYAAARGRRPRSSMAVAGVIVGATLAGMAVAVATGQWVGAGIDGIARILSVGIIAVAILRNHLFDIDIKVKRTVKHGTVVAALAAAYILTSLGAQAFMSESAAQRTGVVLTGLLLFALVPLQRLGGRVADAAMPGVRDDQAYLDQRRIEVYRAALDDASTPSGDIKPGQEARLAALRARLGLTDRDHAILLHALQQPGETPITPTFEPGREVLGRYRVETVLGQGGQGTTYQALDTALGRDIVLKVLHVPDPSKNLKEARALARIDHPNVVTIYDVERVGDHVYLIMEHVDGGSLAERLDAGPLGETLFEQLADDLLSGLHAIHDAGLIHRDVKPSNVLLALDGQPKLADLGIATTADREDQTTIGQATSGPGTVAYMSPEQARGQNLTPASDLYSAAVTLYEAWTGVPYMDPKPGESTIELQMRVADTDGFDKDIDGPEELVTWFEKALAPVPEDRFQRAEEMVVGLRINPG